MPLSPYNNREFLGEFAEGEEPKRYASFADIPNSNRQIPAEQADPLLFPKLTESIDMRYRFGLVLDDDGNVPSTDGVPRVFIMREGKDGREQMTSLGDAGIRLGSADFWKQAQLGNVFIYPAGEIYPVQMKLSLSSPTAPNVTVSKLIEPSEMPVPERKQPGFFQRMLFRINKSFASEETRKYYRSFEDEAANRKMFDEIAAKRVRGAGKEITELRAYEAELAVEIEQKDLETRAQEAEKRYQERQNGLRTYRNLTAPKPVFDESIEKNQAALQTGLYTKEGFKALETIDANVSDFKFGGKEISNDAYMGLVASCSLDPKNGENIFRSGQEYDEKLIPALEGVGVSKEFFLNKYPSAHSSFAFVDFLDHTSLRDGEENQFGSAVNPGRKDAIKLLQDYRDNKPGCRKNLAEAITRGIKVTGKLTGMDKGEISRQFMNAGRIMNAAADLLEKDPEMKAIAMNECGLTEDEILTVRGMGAVDKADVAAAKAESRIANAAAYEDNLTAEEKKALAVDVITSRLMSEKLLSDCMLNLKENKAYKEFNEKVNALREDCLKNKLFVPASPDRPLPPKGKLYFEQVTSYQNILADEFVTIPDTAVELGKGAEKNYREIAEQIVETNGLDKMSARELDDAFMQKTAFKGTELLDKGTAAAQEIQARKAAEKQAGKMSIKERAKMFEEKAPEEKPAEELKVKPSESIKERAKMFEPQL